MDRWGLTISVSLPSGPSPDLVLLSRGAHIRSRLHKRMVRRLWFASLMASTASAAWSKPAQAACTKLQVTTLGDDGVHVSDHPFAGTYLSQPGGSCNGRPLFASAASSSAYIFWLPAAGVMPAVWALGTAPDCSRPAVKLHVASLAQTPDLVPSASRWVQPQGHPVGMRVRCTGRKQQGVAASRVGGIGAEDHSDRKQVVSIDAEVGGMATGQFTQLQKNDLMAAIGAVLDADRFAEITMGRAKEWEGRGVIVEINVPAFGAVESQRMSAVMRGASFASAVKGHLKAFGMALPGLQFSRPLVSDPVASAGADSTRSGDDNAGIIAFVAFLTLAGFAGSRQLQQSAEKKSLGQSRKYRSVAAVPSDDDEEGGVGGDEDV